MRRLTVIRYKGVEYFLDVKLKELRSNTRPIEFIPIGSAKAKKILISYFLKGGNKND